MASEIEILELLNVLGMAFPSAHVTEGMLALYVSMLQDLPVEQLQAAVREHIGRSPFYPTVAEIRSQAFAILESAIPTPDGYAAWAEVQSEIKRVGHRGTPQFSNPLVTETVNIFGWRYLCLSENDMSDRSHFVQAYESRRKTTQDCARQLPETKIFIEQLKSNQMGLLSSGQ